MVRVRYLWLSGWHCRPDFFLSRRFHQQPHSGFRSFCHRLSCKTAREHFLWFCRRLGGTRPRAENIAHHDGSANGTDWLVANLLFWYFDRETIVQWAWRLPFLLSIPLTFFIIAMRRAIHDFPVPSTK